MEQEKEKEIFEGMTVSALMKEAYEQKKNQEAMIRAEIERLLDMIEGPGDAIVLMPLVQDLLNSGLKNDEVLIKMAQIFTKNTESKSKSTQEESSILSEKELEQLLGDLPIASLTESKTENQIK